MMIRMYSGADGQSHFEDLDTGKDFFSKVQSATAIVFKNHPLPSRLFGWHPAPRRQYCITLSGSVDIRVGDGTGKTFRPGDIFLAEDITGQGHALVPKGDWTRVFIRVE